MSPGVNAKSKSRPADKTEESSPAIATEVPDDQDLKTLLEQLNYCLAIAKRLADASLTKAIKNIN